MCTGHNLRYVNATLSAVCLCLFWAIGADMAAGFKGSKQGTGSTGAGQASDTQDAGNQRAGGVTRWLLQPASPLELALMLAAYPLHAFYAPLYYTDVGALAALLTCHLLLLRGRPYAATAAALAAVAFRQTNAVWVAFLLGDALLREASAAAISMPQQRPPPPAQPAAAEGAAAEQPSLLEELASVLAALWEARWRLLAHYAPLAAVPAAFVAFVVLNGGVAVGDKEAHAPVRHIMQCHYCALWLAAAAAPPLLEHARQVAAGAGAVRRRLGMAGSAALAAAGLAMVAGSVASPTPGPHPYLLADNRHYTFYLWRRLLGGPLQLRIMLVPAFLASWALLAGVLLQRKSRLWCMGLLACTAAVLLPAWLLELRWVGLGGAGAPAVALVALKLCLPLPPPTRATATAITSSQRSFLAASPRQSSHTLPPNAQVLHRAVYAAGTAHAAARALGGAAHRRQLPGPGPGHLAHLHAETFRLGRWKHCALHVVTTAGCVT